jgi:hypothetical protein
MKKTLFILMVSATLLPSLASADIGMIGNVAASMGDWLSSWGRKDSAQQPSGVVAPTAIVATGPVGNACNQQQAKLANDHVTQQIANINAVQPPSQSIADMSCFDKYLKPSISSMVGLPSLAGLMTQLQGQACTYVDTKANTAINATGINKNMWLPGGVG